MVKNDCKQCHLDIHQATEMSQHHSAWRPGAAAYARICITMAISQSKSRFRFSGDDQPVCSACQSPLTVKHFLIECVNFAAIRSRYFSAYSMKNVFENVNAQSVIDFIREIHFCHEL